jgi:2-keto-4-pentenoate hydratase/2-oxohepta-3-ene-1,7-dioic acid hydratase in catechol pathway
MRKILSAVTALVVAGVLGAAWMAVAQAQSAAERFGLGTFTYQNRTFVGVVMRYPIAPQQIGGVVVELAAAAKAANLTGIPTDLLSIMDQWNTAGPKIKQIVAQVGPTIDTRRPAYVYDFKAVDARAPFIPRLAFYGFSNYRPVPGTPPPATAPKIPPSMPGLWERAANDDRPQNPRLFMIPNTPEVFIGDGEPIINWHADRRKDYEYECEMLGVVGRPMRRVPVDQVKNYMFGYTNTNDVSDRQARLPDPIPQDWLVQKGWDSMKPVGPFVVPQEFVDPLNTPLKMTVAGTLVQDSNTNQAWHSMYEYAAYLSNMLTLPVGTVIALGTPPGSHGGLGRHLIPGDVQVCSYQGLGTLTNTMIAEPAPRTTTSSR